jgi:hypothetical protein
MNGVAEEATEFRRDDVFEGAKRFRRIAGIGPIYEVVEAGSERVKVRMIDKDDLIDLPRAEVELDPLA